jgi:hypothetical protein
MMKVTRILHNRRQRFLVKFFFLNTIRRVPIDIKTILYIRKFVLIWLGIPSGQNKTARVHSLIRIAVRMKMDPMQMISLSIIGILFII